MQKNKGITLIALVITIIILLILAGITIAQLTENGLFGKSKIAKENYEKEAVNEELQMAMQTLIANYISENKELKTENIKTELQNFLEKKLINWIDEENNDIKLKGNYKDYIFIIDKNNIIKIVGKNEENRKTLESVLEIGKYVKYEAKGYSNWIIAGQNEDGEILLVSEGGTELYTINGADANDVYDKLDKYCYDNYLDNKYAVKAESYSYSKNVSLYTTNDIVIFGTLDGTSNELLEQYSGGWFFNNWCTRFSYEVYKLGNPKQTSSYVSLGDKCFIRPVVYLRYGIEISEGDGSKDNPYKLIENSGYEISPNKKLKTGEYVQYSANNYSKWITVGTDNENVSKIVSLGATDYYNWSGTNAQDAYEKLDNYCNEKYVDNNLATSAENYSYVNNISPYTTTNTTVLYGLTSATSSELMAIYPYAWFLNSYDTRSTGGVYKLGTGDWSYIGINGSTFIRPVVTLKKEIIITGGKGTEENPYILSIK